MHLFSTEYTTAVARSVNVFSYAVGSLSGSLASVLKRFTRSGNVAVGVAVAVLVFVVVIVTIPLHIDFCVAVRLQYNYKSHYQELQVFFYYSFVTLFYTQIIP